MIINDLHNEMLNSQVRKLEGRVEIYEGSTLTLTCGCHDALKSFTVERLGEEGKFFGFGVCAKLNVKLIDPDRSIDVSTANTLEVVCGVDRDYIYPFPHFYVTEVNRNENTNEISVTAYDDLIVATGMLVTELPLPLEYSLRTLCAICAQVLDIPLDDDSIAGEEFDLMIEGGANFNGDETVRQVLNYIAEATQTIYYINKDWKLTFKRLNKNGSGVTTIGKNKYFTLNSRTNRRLDNIAHVTDLGENVVASTGLTGSTQYIRNNPFWSLQDNIGELLQAAIDRVGGLRINQFDLEWRGNYLLEIGDKFAMVTKDDDTVHSFLLNDTLLFDGAFSQHTEWSYANNDVETAENPANLGTALNQTFAKVDKVNRQIQMVVSESQLNTQTIAQLQLNASNINANVSKITEQVKTTEESLTNEIETLRQEVSAKVSAEDVKITIEEELKLNEVTQVKTTTGFTFNQDGLLIDKSGTEMTTQITEDGMTVYRSGEAVLVANNEGVIAEDLHATTYLNIGKYSRFEDYEENFDYRTGCFWMGEE